MLLVGVAPGLVGAAAGLVGAAGLAGGVRGVVNAMVGVLPIGSEISLLPVINVVLTEAAAAIEAEEELADRDEKVCGVAKVEGGYVDWVGCRPGYDCS